MRKWVQRLGQHICGIAITQQEEAYVPASSSGENGEKNASNVKEDEEPGSSVEHVVSGESSPVLSCSSPYIPISECYSGQPIASGNSVEYTNVEAFPFPPKKTSSGSNGNRGMRPGYIACSEPYDPPPARPPRTMPSEDSVTYLQLDTAALNGAMLNSPTKASHHRAPEPGGEVEYRLIDFMKTKALSQVKIEREQQLLSGRQLKYNKGG